MPNVRYKGRYDGGMPVVYDPQTGEVVNASAPVFFYDDFLGAGHTAIPTTVSSGSNWCAKIVKSAGNVTVGAVANGQTGQVALVTDATNEKQDAVLYCFDQRAYTVNIGLVYETRIQLGTIPTTGTKAVFGIAAAWADGQNNIAQYLRFAVNGNGTLLCETQDGTTQLSVSSGVTIGTNSEWHVLRIDASDVTSIKFFIDGNPVATSTTFPFAATGANAQVQPYASVYKVSGTSVGTVNLDYVAIWQNRA